MDCKRTDELLVDFLYGELDQGGRAGFERHLAGCPACARFGPTYGDVIFCR